MSTGDRSTKLHSPPPPRADTASVTMKVTIANILFIVLFLRGFASNKC
jgi:hypothetical protein